MVLLVPTENLEQLHLGGRRDHLGRDPVEVDTDEFINVEDTILGAQLRLSYEPPKDWLMVYAEARYEDRDTTIPNEDYDQLLLTLGVRLKI